MTTRYAMPVTAVLLASIILLAASLRSSRAIEENGGPSRVITDEDPIVLEGLDPVLLVTGKEEREAKFHSVRKGLRYQFVSAANKAAFDKNPEKYEVQNDGNCSTSFSVKGTPSIFTVHNEKLYLFYCTFCREAFLKEPEKYLKPRKTVVVFLFDDVELLDFAGPVEVFSAADYRVVTVAASERPITSMGSIKITPNYRFENCPKPDVLVVPGGSVYKSSQDPRVIEWIKKSSANAEITLSVCTGALLLAEAGLLDGKDATTHWGAIESFKSDYPKVKVVNDRRYVDNGNLVTTAGISAGIDGSLHVISKLLNKESAQKAARDLEYVSAEWPEPTKEPSGN